VVGGRHIVLPGGSARGLGGAGAVVTITVFFSPFPGWAGLFHPGAVASRGTRPGGWYRCAFMQRTPVLAKADELSVLSQG